jgi:hypothetical protein
MTQKMSDTIDVVIRFIRNVGVPTAILAAVLWMLREAGGEVHREILVPAVRAHTQFLDVTQQSLSKLADAQEEQAEAHARQAEALVEIGRTQQAVIQMLSPKPE